MLGRHSGCGLVAMLGALVAALVPAPSHADGDIVYSARYYLPGRQPSYHHIWRINPDGSGRRAVTSGPFDDDFPVWLADGRTILFMRDSSETRWWCTVADSGGPATRVTDAPANGAWWWWTSPERDRIVYLFSDYSYSDDGPDDGANCWRLSLLDIPTRRIRPLGNGTDAAWSPDGRRLFMSFGANCPDSNARAVDLASGTVVALPPSLSAATWLDDSTLVAEELAAPAEEGRVCSRLVVLRIDGTRVAEVTMPYREYEGGCFADALHAIPGIRNEVLHARHAGNSTEGPAQTFQRVNLETGRVVPLLYGRDLAWAPDGRRFLTGEGRRMARLAGVGRVWTSSLFLASLRDASTQSIVEGLVEVGGFDWRP